MGKQRHGPAEKRYRRKKRLVTGSCLIVIFGAIFVAALAVMKTVGVLGPADTSFAAGQTFSEASPEGKGEGDQERANGTAGPIGPESASLIAQEPAPDGSQRNIQSKTGAVLLDVPYVSQLGQYPTGCESVSAVMALQHLGISITVDEFIDNYLDLGIEPWTAENGQMYGGDPWEAFLGDPREASGWGCYAPVIKKAIDRAVDTEKYQVSTLFGIPLETLCEMYVDQNTPVIIWATIDMEYPTPGDRWLIEEAGRELQWMRPEHCLLLVGYDREFYYFNDPTAGKQYRYEKSDCEAAYAGMHEQAVVVYEK